MSRRIRKAMTVPGRTTTTRELPQPANVPLNLTPRGTPGLRHSGGYIIEEFLRKLVGRNGVQQYREMHMNSPQIGAILYFLEALVRRVPWRFEPNPASKREGEAKKNAEFFEECWNDMEHTAQSFIEEVLTYLMYGFATFEKVYKIRRGPMNIPELKSKYKDGRIGWRKFELRSQDTLLRWEIDRETGTISGMWQQDPWSGKTNIYIANEYLIHFKHHQHKNNPEGRSLFRNSVIPYLRLKRIEEVEAIGVERDLVGMLVMEVPPNILDPNGSEADIATKNEIESMLSALNRNEREFAMIPSEQGPDGKPTGYKLRTLGSGGPRQLDVVRIKESFKTDIFMAALVQFLMLGQGDKGGSYSLASSSTSLATMAVGAILDNICETLQKQAIEPLAVLNQIEPEDTPILKHGDIEKPELELLNAFISMMHTTGNLQQSDKLVEHLHKLADLPYDPTAPIKPAAAETELAAQLGKKPGEEDDTEEEPKGKKGEPPKTADDKEPDTTQDKKEEEEQ